MRLKLKKFPLVCGVLNVTPDSFSDGGRYLSPEKAVERALEMAKEGAGMIDIGGESSRPGSRPVSAREEMKRILPVLEKLAAKLDIPVSVDTRKPEVARICLESGASLINDISGFSDPEMIETVSGKKAGAVVMHMKGNPANMQKNPRYGNVLEEVSSFLKERSEKLKKAGVKDVIVDPGIGFGKRLSHNLTLINGIGKLKKLGNPVMVGLSRKSFIGMISPSLPSERLPGSISAAVISYLNGADIFRVHDVRETRQALEVAMAVMKNGKRR